MHPDPAAGNLLTALAQQPKHDPLGVSQKLTAARLLTAPGQLLDDWC